MSNISIIMPSLRPEECLQRIEEFSQTNPDVDYEIVVVSPFPIQNEKVVHIYEAIPQGCLNAHRVAYSNSSGEYIVFWADDAHPTNNCLSIIVDFVKHRDEPFIGSFRMMSPDQEELDPWKVYGKLYACYGCVSRKSLELVGGYFDPIFRNNWADPDLALRVWQNGGRVELCPDAWMVLKSINDENTSNNLQNYFNTDTEAFLDRWHDELGRGFDRIWRLINQPVHPLLALAGTTKLNQLGHKSIKETLKILFLNPEQYLDFENEPSNYELRLPILNCGLSIEHRDYIYQRVLRSEGREKMNEGILQEVLEFKPDLVVYSTSWPHERISTETLQEVMNQGVPIYTHVWDTHTERQAHEIEWAINCNYLGIADSVSNYLNYRLLSEIKTAPKGVIFTIGNFFGEVIKKIDDCEKIYDVTLVGSKEGQRLQLLDYLRERLAEHGTAVSKFGGLANSDESEKKDENQWISIDSYVKLINQSKICLSSQTDLKRDQIKSRVFEYLACGSLCLTDSNEELKTIVPEGCVVYYSDFNDCANKIIYYLEHEDERVSIANAGYNWFHSNFNYKDFWAKFLRAATSHSEPLPTSSGLETKFAELLQDPIRKSSCETEAHYCLKKLDDESLTPILVEGDYHKCNIILCRNDLFGFAQQEGAFDWKKWKRGDYKYCVVGKTLAEVKNLLDIQVVPFVDPSISPSSIPPDRGDDARIQLQQHQISLQQAEDKICALENSLQQAQDKIRAMESSKFWKLRNVWMRIKRLVG